MRSSQNRKLKRCHWSLYIVVCVLFHFSGCAKLPHYASPHLSTVPFNSSLDFVTYRALQVQDFQAKSPPPSIRGNEHRINAHTSVSLRPSTPIHYTISHPNENFGLYKAHMQQLAFKAVMIPARSWWNPELQHNKTGYVLQHEQVHFALMEIAARKLNKELEQLKGKSFSGTDRATVQQQLLDTVQQTIDSAKNNILQEHTRFDEDTSLQYDPESQQQWFDQCEINLKILSRWAQ